MQEEKIVIENVVVNPKFIQYLNGLIIFLNYSKKIRHFLNFVDLSDLNCKTHNEFAENAEKIKEFASFLKRKQIDISKFKIALFDSLVFLHLISFK